MLLLVCLTLMGKVQTKNRHIDPDKIERLQKEKEYSYLVNYQQYDNPLKRIWYWILDRFFRGLSYVTNSTFGSILFYGIIAFTIIYAIIKLLNINIAASFYKSGKSSLLEAENIDDISKIDFERSISDAYKQENFQAVVRFYYLWSLQILDESGVIKWESGKTNMDYLYEIGQNQLKSPLTTLNYYFEYAVYGDFPITKEMADNSSGLFSTLRNIHNEGK